MGLLQPGGTLVEGTAGNTGIGFIHLCNARGYRCVIVMPDNQSPEKAALLRTLGAAVQVVKTVPYADPNHYQKLAPRVAQEIEGAVCGNQFDNTANRDAHYATTGPEIWQQTEGAVDAFRLCDWHGRHAGRRFALSQGAERDGALHSRRSDGERALQLGEDR